MATSYRRKVKTVKDGDTFELFQELDGSKRIRIADLDAPELNEYGGKAAKDKLKNLIEGKDVTIKPVSRSYGRIVAKVYINRRLVNDQL